MTNKDRDSDIKFIKALAEVLRDNDLSEVEVLREYGDDNSLNVRVSRQSATVAAPVMQQAVVAPPPASAPAAAAPVADVKEDPAQHPGAVPSPMVGTVYLQPEPGAGSFVSVGDQVKEGQTVLIIEAMKTMNQIPAPRAGKVTRILVEDGTPVEFGSPLVIIE
jgi:acetyl-CoA carboxylase biotin carboxyl carrier protein